MKTMKIQIMAAIALVGNTLVNAQGTLQNLNFEDANIVAIPGQPFAVTAANAIPDWTVEYGNVQQSQIFYNDASLGAAQVTVIADGYPSAAVTSHVIDGNFSVFLQGGEFDGAPVDASISQIGEIPAGSQFLLFDVANPTFQTEPLAVAIGNQVVSFSSFGTGTANGATYTIYGADISAWAGQREQLTFSASGNILLDDISFSPGTVPEPSVFALTCVGGFLFALYRRFAFKRQ